MSIAENLLRTAASKVDSSLIRENGLTQLAMRRIIRAIDAHGEGGVISMTMMPSWTEHASPVNFVTGYHMIFDANKAQVVPSIVDSNSMFAGTMAFRIPTALLEGSQLSEDGPLVHQSEIAKALNKNVPVTGSGVPDSYAGLFEHKTRGSNDFMREYWAVSRGVDPSLNAALEEQVEAHDGKPYSLMMSATKMLRYDTFKQQQNARAESISAILRSVGITKSADDILNENAYVENVFNMIGDGPSNTVSLHSDAVVIDSQTLKNGLLVTENMHLGPVLLRGDPSAANGKLSVLPSSTGFTMPLYAAMQSETALLYDKKSKLSANNPCTWKALNADEVHPLLATNVYRTRSNAAWKSLESRAGFLSKQTVELTPISVKLAHPSNI